MSMMKHFSICMGAVAVSLFALCVPPVKAQTPGGSQLTVEVSGLRNYKGQLLIYLWRDSSDRSAFPETGRVQLRDEAPGNGACDFPKVSLCRRIVQSLQNLTVTYTFTDLAAGDYAVFVVHDENNNNILDTGLFRRPVEGHGYSSVLPEDLGLWGGNMNWDKTRFTLSGQKKLSLGLKYPPRF
jgi:uncharacterized protein (DUF2141 family)